MITTCFNMLDFHCIINLSLRMEKFVRYSSTNILLQHIHQIFLLIKFFHVVAGGVARVSQGGVRNLGGIQQKLEAKITFAAS